MGFYIDKSRYLTHSIRQNLSLGSKQAITKKERGNMAEHKKRCTRISKAQKELLINYMHENKSFARGQFREFNANDSSGNTWELLTSKLNSQGTVKKSVEQWKKCWTDIKSSAKKQASDMKAFMNATGGGSIVEGPRPLNDLEEKIIAVITMDAVDGDASTPELGRPIVDYIEKENVLEGEYLEPEIIEPTSSAAKRTNTKKVQIPSYLSALKEARALQKDLEDRLTKIENQNSAIIAQNETILQKASQILEQNSELLGILKMD